MLLFTAFSEFKAKKRNENNSDSRFLFDAAALLEVRRSYPDQIKGLDKRVYYVYTDYYDFRIENHENYLAWLNNLGLMVHGPALHRIDTWGYLPFFTLLRSQDAQSIFNQDYAAKLFRTFVKNEQTARKYADSLHDGADWLHSYLELMKVFEIGADNGIVMYSDNDFVCGQILAPKHTPKTTQGQREMTNMARY
jgi:hypothetical protein